jgi:hypothetical protein
MKWQQTLKRDNSEKDELGVINRMRVRTSNRAKACNQSDLTTADESAGEFVGVEQVTVMMMIIVATLKPNGRTHCVRQRKTDNHNASMCASRPTHNKR